ncbi:MAG: hypothetical protein NZ741_07950 [Armatimonadetes bacterium]|nr:hypothetical protein [Armatimonadota bacterium]
MWVLAIFCALFYGSAQAQPQHVLRASPQARFTVSLRDGHLVSATFGNTPMLERCVDEYWLENERGEIVARSDESSDRVLRVQRARGQLILECQNDALGLRLTKTYAPSSVPNALRKTVTIQSCARQGALHLFSRVRLAPRFARDAWLYTPRQSWGGAQLLYGVRPLSSVTAPITSSSGWDNRFVVAFRKDRSLSLVHWRVLVDGLWVPPHGVIAEWGKTSPFALTYLPDGWRWRLLHTVDGEKTSASADYVLQRGDWYDAWASLLAMPECRATYRHLQTMPRWCREVTFGTFWGPPHYEGAVRVTGAMLDALGGEANVTHGVFAWSLDGDYETDRPFLTETLQWVLTPQYLRQAVAALQSHPRSKVGLYIQGGLIDSMSDCYRQHPDWVIRDAEGKPVDSGFRDNPVGNMYMGNPRVEEWVRHHIARIQAVCRTYDCGYIYLDGGGFGETVDWSRRHAIRFSHYRRLNERVFLAVRATGAQRGLLINSQNAPFADMSWLECGYFAPHVPWRETVDFCFDTKMQQPDPSYTLQPLYWLDDDRYLAMCIAFGFTPCGDLSRRDERTLRAVRWARRMKDAQLIRRSDATAPVWWRDEVPVVTFALRRGDEVIVPVLHFGERNTVEVTVDLRAVGFSGSRPLQVTVTQPLIAEESRRVEPAAAGEGRARFQLQVPSGWRGITLITMRQ